jgi:pyruvate,water dikinase
LDPLVAVRSSAIGEDGAESSFAGQHETILNVRGVEAVTDAVLECWRSCANERATAYRATRGIDGPPRIAVLVQQMVPSDVSAIAFGVDPVTQDRTVVVIDAAAGLGDRIASGEITPDHYVVRRTDLSFVENVAGGALSADDARAVAQLVIDLERHNAGAVDVECAFADGDLYLLQCRPVTAMNSDFPVVWRHPDDAKLHWRRDDAHFSAPIPRLLGEYVTNAAHFGMRARAEFFDTPVQARLEGFNGRRFNCARATLPTRGARASNARVDETYPRLYPRPPAHLGRRVATASPRNLRVDPRTGSRARATGHDRGRVR